MWNYSVCVVSRHLCPGLKIMVTFMETYLTFTSFEWTVWFSLAQLIILRKAAFYCAVNEFICETLGLTGRAPQTDVVSVCSLFPLPCDRILVIIHWHHCRWVWSTFCSSLMINCTSDISFDCVAFAEPQWLFRFQLNCVHLAAFQTHVDLEYLFLWNILMLLKVAENGCAQQKFTFQEEAVRRQARNS